MEKSAKKKKVKKEHWIKFRHKVVWTLLKPVFDTYCRVKYGTHVKTFKDYDRECGNSGEHCVNKKPCIILYNHVTAFDQFFVALSCRTPVYYVATEDIFSMGFASKLIKYLVNPIPIKKYSTDIKALKTVLNVAKEGGIISIAPEGNRTYSGRTCNMKDSISPLCSKLKLPIVLLKIDGGYGVQPRWTDKLRKGRIDVSVSEVIYPDEFKNLSDSELFERIKTGLYLDEARDTAVFKSKRKAEYLERAIYTCPKCGFSKFESLGDITTCTGCGLKVKYNADTTIEGVDNAFEFKYVADWYEYQEKNLNSTDTRKLTEQPIYEDTADIYKVIPYKKKENFATGASIKLFGDRIELETEAAEGTGKGSRTISFAEVSGIACMGKNKLNIDVGGEIYQFKGDCHFNSLKYVNFCYRFKNLYKGEENEQFLGL
ncbi:MAG: 1-acyl-sn-glycerol-3-phosphate acyltransferase [Lachnospiraceae bacterium]|nr:1-acyl-sn-glycerol-3-phosphate acyltransferase [Lachnospiraceae bacterium]